MATVGQRSTVVLLRDCGGSTEGRLEGNHERTGPDLPRAARPTRRTLHRPDRRGRNRLGHGRRLERLVGAGGGGWCAVSGNPSAVAGSQGCQAAERAESAGQIPARSFRGIGWHRSGVAAHPGSCDRPRHRPHDRTRADRGPARHQGRWPAGSGGWQRPQICWNLGCCGGGADFARRVWRARVGAGKCRIVRQVGGGWWQCDVLAYRPSPCGGCRVGNRVMWWCGAGGWGFRRGLACGVAESGRKLCL